MTNYQKCKIYKIESHLGDKIYIGATCKEYLSQRFQSHKQDYRRWKNGTHHKITSYEIFDLYGIDNCSIVLLEANPCNSKDELNARESFYIRNMNCVNKVIPDRKIEEYENSEQRKNLKKTYEQTETCKATRKAYKDSEEGKAKAKEYNQTEACKAVKKAYAQSEAGKAKAKANYQKMKALKEATNTAQDPI
jgi:hypothetical protein